MSINSTLKKEGIENIKSLDTLEINKIASSIADKIVSAFPEYGIDRSDLFIAIARLNMYTATMPNDHSVAKYFYKNKSIYFSDDINLNNTSTPAIHESLHFIQEVTNKNGKLLRMGLYNTHNKNRGITINEAAVQLMASIANCSKIDSVKYYDLDIETESPDFYPIQCALIKQMMYFTGSYALFHSTLYGDDIFKNTFIAKTNSKTYKKIEENFDFLLKYEELLISESNKLLQMEDDDLNFKKIKYLNLKIANIKKIISKITIETQELIITNCFSSELKLVRDMNSLEEFKNRLYNFKDILISTENYSFYNDFYCYMMSKLEEKKELIRSNGVLNCLSDYETSLISPMQVFSYKYIKELISKIKLLFHNYKYNELDNK